MYAHGIASGAEVNVNADWNASSGDAEILNKPTIPSTTDDISEGSNLYFTNERAEDAVSLSLTLSSPVRK